jgi:hypothetical protein
VNAAMNHRVLWKALNVLKLASPWVGLLCLVVSLCEEVNVGVAERGTAAPESLTIRLHLRHHSIPLPPPTQPLADLCHTHTNTHNPFSWLVWLSGAFAELLKATIIFFLSVRPSVRPAWKNSAPTGRIFLQFDILVFSKKHRENSGFITIWQE